MVNEPLLRPDITLAIDSDGVIRDAVSSEDLSDESLAAWRGRAWEDTVTRDAGPNVTRLMAQSRQSGESSRIQVHQRLPSGREIPIEYTTISLGKKRGFIATGRNLQMISDLQTRLLDAQQAREQDYWKLRDVETRYRALLDATNEAVALVRASNLRVVEANIMATKSLGLVPGAEFLTGISARDRRSLETMLGAVRAQGRAPSIALHLSSASPWSLRASQITSDAGSFYLFQMTPLAGVADPKIVAEALPLDDLIQRFPDAVVIVDRDGVIRRANHTFLDMTQVGVESALIGQNLRRWLSQPGVDASVLLNMVQRHGAVRGMACKLEGDLGSVTDVEVSAVGDRAVQARHFGIILKDNTSREPPEFRTSLSNLTERTGDISLPQASLDEIVKASVEQIERRCIAEALEKNNGNRTQAAKYLGVSRQSLHMKLNKYKFGQIRA
jgi:transcriptional regulator PpsR